MIQEFIFNITPKPKERPRFSTRGGKHRTFTSANTRHFENSIAMLAKFQMKGKPVFEGLLSANIVFEFEKQKKTKLSAPKPDTDNLCKSLLDSLNGIVFKDDSQVCSITALKRWGTKNQIKLLIGHLYEPEL
jgi:Holliday junction resolvase RusA-like endonuclease